MFFDFVEGKSKDGERREVKTRRRQLRNTHPDEYGKEGEAGEGEGRKEETSCQREIGGIFSGSGFRERLEEKRERGEWEKNRRRVGEGEGK